MMTICMVVWLTWYWLFWLKMTWSGPAFLRVSCDVFLCSVCLLYVSISECSMYLCVLYTSVWCVYCSFLCAVFGSFPCSPVFRIFRVLISVLYVCLCWSIMLDWLIDVSVLIDLSDLTALIYMNWVDLTSPWTEMIDSIWFWLDLIRFDWLSRLSILCAVSVFFHVFSVGAIISTSTTILGGVVLLSTGIHFHSNFLTVF